MSDSGFAQRLENLLRSSPRWEASNQATIHHWFLAQLGQIVEPLESLADGIATWPEYATCVGVTLNRDGTIDIIAPHGLDDLFLLRLRHNGLRASAEVFSNRVRSKRFVERWPLLSQ